MHHADFQKLESSWRGLFYLVNQSETGETMKIRDIADRAQGYGIPGAIVDGNDAVAVYEVAREAIRRAR
jgi:TPP-dependent pyruvate/acetoin dehydrogenase alpha subunit